MTDFSDTLKHATQKKNLNLISKPIFIKIFIIIQLALQHCKEDDFMTTTWLNSIENSEIEDNLMWYRQNLVDGLDIYTYLYISILAIYLDILM